MSTSKSIEAAPRARASSRTHDAAGDIYRWIGRNGVAVGLIVLIVYFAVSTDAFASWGNVETILVAAAPTLVAAVPTTFLLIAGEVDLSVGSTAALSAVVSGLLMHHGWSPVPACSVGLAAALAVGCFNGLVVAGAGFSSIVVTLGMLTALRGLVLALSPTPLYGFPASFGDFGQSELLGVSLLVYLALAVLLLGLVALYLLPVGRHVIAVGVNSRAAFLSGVRVDRVRLGAFVFTAFGAGMAGVLFAARLDSAPAATIGSGFELSLLTAILLGGVAFGGGGGSLFGVVMGVLFLQVLTNGLVLHNVSSSWSSIVSGFALVGAAGLQALSRRAKARVRNADENPAPAAAPT